MGIFGKIGRSIVGLPSSVKSNVSGLTKRPGEAEQRAGLANQAQAAGGFAGVGEAGYNSGGYQLDQEIENMRGLARGHNSVSAEQLRQGLQQNVAAQQSMAAGAAPRDQGMAALMASRNAMNLGGQLAGQQAIAGMQERQNAEQALARMLLEKRQQDAQVAMGSRGTAVQGYGAMQPGESWMEKYGGGIMGGLSMITGGGGKKG